MAQEYRKQTEIVSTISIPTLALLEDGFESTTVKWENEQSGGLSGAQTSAASFNGNNAYRMQTRAVGATNSDFQGIVRFVGLSPKPKINFTYRSRNLAVDTAAAREMFQFVAELQNLTLTFELVLDAVNAQVLYRNASNVLVPVPGFVLPNNDDVWKRVEIQFNTSTRRFEFFSVGNRIVDMSTLPIFEQTFASNRATLTVRIRSQQDQGAAAISTNLLVDDVVITNPD